ASLPTVGNRIGPGAQPVALTRGAFRRAPRRPEVREMHDRGVPGGPDPADTAAAGQSLKDAPGGRGLELEGQASDIPHDLDDVGCKLAFFVGPDVLSVRRGEQAFLVRVDTTDPRRAAQVTSDVRALLERLARGYRPLPMRRLFGAEQEPQTTSAGGLDLTR